MDFIFRNLNIKIFFLKDPGFLTSQNKKKMRKEDPRHIQNGTSIVEMNIKRKKNDPNLN